MGRTTLGFRVIAVQTIPDSKHRVVYLRVGSLRKVEKKLFVCVAIGTTGQLVFVVSGVCLDQRPVFPLVVEFVQLV